MEWAYKGKQRGFAKRPYGNRNTHIVGERFFSANRSPTKHIAQSTEALVVQNNQIGGDFYHFAILTHLLKNIIIKV